MLVDPAGKAGRLGLDRGTALERWLDGFAVVGGKISEQRHSSLIAGWGAGSSVERTKLRRSVHEPLGACSNSKKREGDSRRRSDGMDEGIVVGRIAGIDRDTRR